MERVGSHDLPSSACGAANFGCRSFNLVDPAIAEATADTERTGSKPEAPLNALFLVRESPPQAARRFASCKLQSKRRR
jgi:hypothetical protein